MPLKVALQMDPIGSVNIEADSTFRIALEAQARGHSLFFYTPDRLAFVEGRVMAGKEHGPRPRRRQLAADPVQPPLALHVLALLDDQLSVELAPARIDSGFAVSVSVGAGGAVTVTVTLREMVPPSPVHSSV